MGVVGIDFGTSNSVASRCDASGQVETLNFSRQDGREATFPSLLTFWQEDGPGRAVTRVEGGQWAIDAFQLFAPDCRFLKSIKTFAGNTNFASTSIYGHRYEFSDLMRVFLSRMADHSGFQPGWGVSKVVIGRPIRFAGAMPDSSLAMRRYRKALSALGFQEQWAVYEPLAAAYFFVRDLRGSANIFIGDLGGGTSDFSIVKVARNKGVISAKPLAAQGLGIAGDQLDYRIIQNTVAKKFGKGSKYKSQGAELTVPNSFYSKLARWNEASMMKGTKAYRDLLSIKNQSLCPERISKFIGFLESESIYDLYESVSTLKQRLSSKDAENLQLIFNDEEINMEVSRKEFDRWISGDIERLDSLITITLQEANLEPEDIDAVFLTGGTSFVPAIRALFANRFGKSMVETGDQLVSVAKGLAMIAQDEEAMESMAERVEG
jgi:hypothetical chaperone protein